MTLKPMADTYSATRHLLRYMTPVVRTRGSKVPHSFRGPRRGRLLAAYAVVADPQGLARKFPLALGKVQAHRRRALRAGEFPPVGRSSDAAPTSARRARASGAPTRSSHTRLGSASLTRVFSSSAEGAARLRALRRPSSVEVDLNSLGQVVLTHATLCPSGKSVSYVSVTWICSSFTQ